MFIRALNLVFTFAFVVLTLSACSTAKLEARLEANPQCKDVINPKTGALMPCPGTDRAFYRAAGLEPAKPIAPNLNQADPSLNVVGSAVTTESLTKAGKTEPPAPAAKATNSVPSKNDCKPTIHNKTGGMMPCLSPD